MDQLSITEEAFKTRVKNTLVKLGVNDERTQQMIGLKAGPMRPGGGNLPKPS